MSDDVVFDLTLKRYDQEFSRYVHLDSKAISQIGFSGIIISILSFILSTLEFDKITANPYLPLIGLGLLLGSVFFGILALTKSKKTLPRFEVEKFHKKFKGTEDEKRNRILVSYFELIKDFDADNNRKAVLIYIGNIATLSGLIVSFITFLLIFNVIEI